MKAQQQEVCSPFQNDKDHQSRIYLCLLEMKAPAPKLFQGTSLAQVWMSCLARAILGVNTFQSMTVEVKSWTGFPYLSNIETGKSGVKIKASVCLRGHTEPHFLNWVLEFWPPNHIVRLNKICASFAQGENFNLLDISLHRTHALLILYFSHHPQHIKKAQLWAPGG